MISPRPLPLPGVLMIVAAGVGLGLGYNALSPEPLPWLGQPAPEMKSLDSLQTSEGSNGTTTSPTPEIVELGNTETPSTPVERQHLTTDPVPPPVGTVDSNAFSAGPPSNPEVEAIPDTAKATTSAPETPRSSNSDIPESEDPIRISLAQAKQFFDRGGVLILDARDPAEYAEGHIQGAVSAYTDEKVGDIAWLETTAKDSRPIIIYCGGGDCELSIQLGIELTRTGHRRVLVFEEGYPAWQGAGYPVLEGTAP